MENNKEYLYLIFLFSVLFVSLIVSFSFFNHKSVNNNPDSSLIQLISPVNEKSSVITLPIEDNEIKVIKLNDKDSSSGSSGSSRGSSGGSSTIVAGFIKPVCGNEITEGDEECDDGNNDDYDECTNSCERRNKNDCGKGIGSPDKECKCHGFDFGVAKWECNGIWSLDKEIYSGTSVTGNCDNAFWDVGSSNADGIVVKAGNIKHGGYYYSEEGATGTINLPKDISHITFCGYNETQEPECGNNKIDSGEECDLGSDNGNQCVPEYNKTCTYCSSDCKNKTLTRFCGDNVLDSEEECDDGNNINGDGCSANCTIEKECCDDNNCPNDKYSNGYCYSDDVYKNLTDYFCKNHNCLFNISRVFVQECGEDSQEEIKYCYSNDVWINSSEESRGCEQGECFHLSNFTTKLFNDCGEDSCNDWSGYVCEGKNRTRQRTCYDKGCEQANCFSTPRQEKQSEECAYGCVDGECSQPRCGDNHLDLDEECDDGNLINGDGCDSDCTIEICEHDVGIRYSYGNSFGTGIAIGLANGTWLHDPVELTQNQDYIIKYIIDNKIQNITNNIHVIVKIDETTIANYNKSIINHHDGEVSLNISNLPIGTYNLSVYVEKINETDCNLSDNYAEREIIVKAECCDDEQCPENSYSDNYCLNNNVWRNLTDYFCKDGKCLFNITSELFINCGDETYSNEYCYNNDVYQNHSIPGCENNACTLSNEINKTQDCGEDSCNDWSGYVCEGKNKTRTRTCYDKGCEQANCFSTPRQEKQSEECAYNCVNGNCIDVSCYTDDDCPADSWLGQEFCQCGKLFDYYRDYSCENEDTPESYCQASTKLLMKGECNELLRIVTLSSCY